jgi:hypothetical protein
MAGEAVIGAILLALTTQADTTAQRSGDIIVTARPRPPAAIIAKRVRAITRRSSDQVARFAEPVCAGALGFAEPYAGMIRARIMAVAKAAGVPTAGADCRSNITLLVVSDGKLLLTELKRQKPAIFNAMPPREVERALAEPGPVRVITITELRSRDGNRLSADYTRGNSGGLAGGASTLLVNSASIINLATRQDITGSLVLIDTAATFGKTLNQLADYTAMRTLAKTNATAEADDDTILSLFADPAHAPRTLTSFDAAFLKALYHGPATLKYGTKLAAMTRDIVEEP